MKRALHGARARPPAALEVQPPAARDRARLLKAGAVRLVRPFDLQGSNAAQPVRLRRVWRIV